MTEQPLQADTVVRDLGARPTLETLISAVRAAVLSSTSGPFVDTGPLAALTEEVRKTPFGDVFEASQRRDPTRRDRLLLGALCALSLKGHLESMDSDALARRLLWLSGNTAFDALPALDAALGEEAEPLFRAFAGLLGSSPGGGSDFSTLRGELTWAPRGSVATVLLAISGLLFIRHAAAVLARYALALRRPAEVRLSERGLQVMHRLELLGRVVRDREMLVPIQNLASVTREVRYARAGLYAGLLALVLGTYLGMGLLVDGVRAPSGSPSLLGLGLLLIAAGLALDFALTTLLDSAKHTVRLVVVPQKGRTLCVRGLSADAADALLRRLAQAMASA